ncbi:MAG: galactose-1-epimerase, partial [Lysobacterales bacterium]
MTAEREGSFMKRAEWITSLLFATVLTLPATVRSTEATRGVFGTLADGSRVEAVTLSNGHGVSARVITLGASLQSLVTPDRTGKSADIILGYARPDGYIGQPQYFGATVGRYANRIAKGRFTLDGKSYQVPINDGPNSLHGGTKGFDKRMWKIDSVSSGPDAKVVLSYVSADGEEGYPGELKV